MAELPMVRGGRAWRRAVAGAWPAPAVLVSGLAALGLVALWLAAPALGTDLAAQVARADFFAAHGWAPVDFRWYAGISPLGYSLVSPPLMAWFGVRPVGAVAAVATTVGLTVLLVRTQAPRPLLGGLLGAVGVVGNLVSGRVTFAVGVAWGWCAPRCCLWGDSPRPTLTSVTVPGAGLLAALAAATSPVAGLFVGLAGTALLLHARLPHRSGVPRGLMWAGVALAGGAAVPMVVMGGLFGTGGPMNISRADMLHATVTSLVVAALVPRRVVRIGAGLSAAGVVAAYLVTTPVGLNATRLATVFAAVGGAARPGLGDPRVAATAVASSASAGVSADADQVGAVAAVVTADLARSGAGVGGCAPLVAELTRRPPNGRVEVVPTVNYWEAARLGELPLARGWLRQADLARNRLFFDGSLDAESYRRWLDRLAVSHVAVPHTRLSWVGRAEAELIGQGLPYLREVWSHPDWTLYEVRDPTPLVSAPATVVAATATGMEFDVPAPGEVRVAVWPSRWLAVDGPAGACLVPGEDHVVVRIAQPGRYALTGSLTRSAPRC